MRCVLLCELSSLFYLLILFPYKSVTEIRLVFSANKFTQGSKIFIFLQAEFQELPKQVEIPKQVERSKNRIALLFFDNARTII